MKGLICFLLVCISCMATVNAQSTSSKNAVEMSYGLDPLHATLELTLELIQQRYCSDNTMQLAVSLNFSNQGANSLILDAGTRPIPTYLLSRSVENATKRRYESVVNRLLALDNADSLPDESNFVILKPGETFRLEQRIRLQHRQSMREGRHVLQLVVPNWRYWNVSNVEWRDRWQSRGYLWTDPITSAPMAFIIERKAAIVDCQEN